MRMFLAVILIIVVAGTIAAVVFMPDESEQTAGQPSPHAIDQGK